MELLDIITISISIVALIISIISSVISHRQNYIINQYEFVSKEKTKEDILKILSALHLIVDKTMHSHLIQMNIEKEKEVVLDFLLSDTWLAIKYVMKDNEYIIPIITNFLLLLEDNVEHAGEIALELEDQICKICELNIDNILKEKRKLGENLGRFAKENNFNRKWYEKRKRSKNEYETEAYNRLLFLKHKKNIQDINIDFWIGFLGHDIDIVKDAVNNGVNGIINIAEIIEKYKDY